MHEFKGRAKIPGPNVWDDTNCVYTACCSATILCAFLRNAQYFRNDVKWYFLEGLI